MRNLKVSDQIIRNNQANLRFVNIQTQQIQSSMSSHENVLNWKFDDTIVQFLTKTKTRRTPTGELYSPKERVPLATDIKVSIGKIAISTSDFPPRNI